MSEARESVVQADKNRIVNEVMHLISVEGHSAVSVESVARALGEPVELIKQHYPTTAALIRASQPATLKVLDGVASERLQALEQGAGSRDVLSAIAESYFSFARSNPKLFYCFMTEHAFLDEELEASIVMDFQLDASLTLNVIAENAAALVAEVKGDEPSTDDVDFVILSLWAAVHGLSHLCTLGILRHLGKGMHRQLMDALLAMYFAGVDKALREPNQMVCSDKMGSLVAAAQDNGLRLEDVVDSAVRREIFLATREEVADNGAENLTLASVAERDGHDVAFVATLFDTPLTLLRQMEDECDEESYSYLVEGVRPMGEDANAIDGLIGMIGGYCAWAIDNPEAFDAIIFAASQSIIPEGESPTDPTAGMGKAYALEVQYFQRFFEEQGATADPWLTYRHVLIGWASVHGIAHMISRGYMHRVPLLAKVELIANQANITILGLLDTMTRK
ncbi:WHG domain-containing protein [Corynebacterium incognita]|uniref:WHG domain-containing protein n=1 Tax=Corynebacterium incognita TaxID=2754725 RepID=A0A7G7CNR1_9CORY|nr:WHG domain-containing protein [Corynebacterium incognita]QNE89227.1 WHG domain-containing protein [Corynebacterium incognita]